MRKSGSSALSRTRYPAGDRRLRLAGVFRRRELSAAGRNIARLEFRTSGHNPWLYNRNRNVNIADRSWYHPNLQIFRVDQQGPLR